MIEIDMNLIYIAVSIILFFIFLFIVYLIINKKRSIQFSKINDGDSSKVTIKLHKPVEKFTLTDRKDIKVIRKNIKQDEVIEIVYPRSQSTAKLVVEFEDKKETYEIKVKK